MTLIHFTIDKKNYVANIVVVTVKLQVSIHVILLENNTTHYLFYSISILYFPIHIYTRT
jgi:hypothetical protein